MTHRGSIRALQKVVAPKRAVGWFIRYELWALGYRNESGQRVELARGQSTQRTLNEAVRAYRKGVR